MKLIVSRKPSEPSSAIDRGRTVLDHDSGSADKDPRHESLGRVTLVGAGPGDPDLLTMKAVKVLQSADVVLFDDLVSQEILDLARKEARRLLVGKRGYRQSCKQDDINAMMITFARSGKHVIRLKSGDPMIFGRAGEELAMLKEAGIEASVVPGITAASAMAANLNVSLTHRDHSQAVTFVTGHAKDGQLPRTLNVEALSKPHQSIIVYMGGRTSKALAQELVEAGAVPDCPCIAVRNISRPDQSAWTGTIAELHTEELEKLLPGDGPVLLALGETFGKVTLQERDRDLLSAISMKTRHPASRPAR